VIDALARWVFAAAAVPLVSLLQALTRGSLQVFVFGFILLIEAYPQVSD
jgi:hypothetical protein